MQTPLSLWDAAMWVAVTAIVLLVTAELTSPYYGKTGLTINRRRLKNVALVFAAMFMITVAIRIIGIIYP
jgi:ABC-type nitrate/sulfonate/bicarbonate transport system permease component